MLIYKILLPPEWAEFEAAESFEGSPFDHSSRFIHCSSREQVADTARRIFGREPALVVVAVDSRILGDSLRWEAAPNQGSMFPHVYGVLPRSAVVEVHHVAGASAVAELFPTVPDA